VEGARREPARHEEVSSPFRRRAGEERRLDFEESMLVQVVAYGAAGGIPNLKPPEHGGAAHIEIAILEAEYLVHLRLAFGVDLKGQGPAVVQHLELARVDLDGARGDPRVLRARRTRGYRAAYGHHELPTDVLDLGVRPPPPRGGIEAALGDPRAIADVDKDEPAVIAPSVHPAHEGHRLPGVGGAEGTAGVRALPAAHGLHAERAHVDAPLLPSEISSSASLAMGTRRCSPVFISRSTTSPAPSSLSPAMTA